MEILVLRSVFLSGLAVLMVFNCHGQPATSGPMAPPDSVPKSAEIPTHPVGLKLSDFYHHLDESDPLLIHLKEIEGAVLLDFWASWCQPCIRHQNEMMKHKNDLFDAQGVTIVGISVKESPQLSRVSHKSRKLSWKSFPDTKGTLTKALGTTSIPQYVLVDTNGIITGVYTGFKSIQAELQKSD